MNDSEKDNVLIQALDHVRDRLREGLRHGFFECTIACEVVKDRKRRLVVRFGTSEQFTIPAAEVEEDRER